MSKFIFEGYSFNNGKARFSYSFDEKRKFVEEVQFAMPTYQYDEALLDRALFLAFILVGTSYFKTFPTREVLVMPGQLDEWQVSFFNAVYQEGLSQFAFENDINRAGLAWFSATPSPVQQPVLSYKQKGTIALQSGGKDSLLTTTLLQKALKDFSPWYITSSGSHPKVLDELGKPLLTAQRYIDRLALQQAIKDGGKNGHVPVTYIVQSFALIQAILLGKNKILVSIGHEGEEPHAMVEDLPISHQWSKTWSAEQLFSQYVERYVSPDFIVGSPLRGFSELYIAEMFVSECWQQFGHSFSSCNVGNYKQETDNTDLTWCGNCPKCANSFLLFAPFVEAEELKSLFGGRDLFAEPALVETFKGLLGIDDVMKPFECVGEVDELRQAYHMVQAKEEYNKLPFGVPSSTFDYKQKYQSQDIAI